MTFEEASKWIADNTVPLVVGAVAAGIAEIAFKELVWDEFIAPSLRHRVKFAKARAKKWLRNPSLELSHSANITGLKDRRIKVDQIPLILEFLKDNKIPARRLHNLGIRFDNCVIGKLTFSGIVEFSAGFNLAYLESLTITLTTQIAYKSMQSDITAVTHFMHKIQEYVNQALGIPLSYTVNIACKLEKLEELSGILKDLKIDYMSLGGDVQLTLTKDKIVFDEPIDYSIVVPKIKEFAVLFG